MRVMLAVAAGACFAGIGFAALANDAAGSAAAPVKPFVREDDCRWWLSGTDGKELRVSVSGSYSSEDPVLTIADPVFLRFGEELRPRLTLRANGQRRHTAEVEAWSSHIGKETALLGMFMDKKARSVFGLAKRIEIISGGEVLIDLPLAKTPSAGQLGRCVLPGSLESEGD